jgi:hypothetical protein
MGGQKMLYKDRSCITLPPSKLRGTTYYYSSASVFNKKNKTADIGIDTLFEFRFVLEYASRFMDSVYCKKECINDGVFVVKIFKHSSKDTLLEFSMSYIKNENELRFVHAGNYITAKGRKVLVVFSDNLKSDILQTIFPILKREEDFSKYLSNPPIHDAYTGKYQLQGGKIAATFSPPYFIDIPAEERITW